MKSLVNAYNYTRMALTIMGPLFVLLGVITILYPESVTTHVDRREVEGWEEMKQGLFCVAVGLVMIFVRFFFLKYRKNPDFSSDIPLPTDVTFEKTDDVVENIRRYKAAQRKAVEEKRR
ncbi:hypothetical protein [Hahella ganghwensis]|uniref:hypothetical protein n=1 Tax=Hahella ganghwensis TaxID=286420 RepID=UPI000377CA19|nr:hypothetical protein [Hahella ganghwensis]